MSSRQLERILLEMGARSTSLEPDQEKGWIMKEGRLTYLVKTSQLHNFLSLSITTPVMFEEIPLFGEIFYQKMHRAISELHSEFGFYRLTRELKIPFLSFTTCMWIDKKPTRQGFSEYITVCASCIKSALMLLRYIADKGDVVL